jgi:hypothetical protein
MKYAPKAWVCQVYFRLNLGRPELRSDLGRVFGRGKMRSASEQKRAELDAHFKKQPAPSPELTIFKHLHTVAYAFISAQQRKRTTTPGRSGTRLKCRNRLTP